MKEAPLEAGALVAGRYRVEAPLGEGGMARIYRATDAHLDRPVALKVMRLVAAAHAARFEREARAAAGLRHPSAVRVYDYGVLDDGRPYLVLEFIEGRTLHQVITEEGPLAPRAALDLLRPIIGALGEAHAAGVIHRDLKPENLMLQPAPGLTALVRLLDFGIAAVDPLSTDERLTRTGAVFGTPAFMSPEQALGKAVTPASDVWAVGATLQCLVTGAPPFAADSPPEILVEVIRSAPAPLPDDVPGAVRGLIELCLQKDPTARPADGAALLARWPTAPRPVPPPVGATGGATGNAGGPAPADDARPGGVASDAGGPGAAADAPPPASAPPAPSVAPTVAPLAGPANRRAMILAGGALAVGLVVGLAVAPRGAAPPAPAAEADAADAAVGPLEPPDDPLSDVDALLDAEQSRAALSWLEAHAEVGAPERRLLLRGLARLAEGQVETGIADLAAALQGDPALARDARVLPALLGALKHRDAEGAVPLLGGPLAGAAEARLRELAATARHRERWRAVEALELKHPDDHAPRLAALQRDLRAGGCELRKKAARALGELGDPAALPDLRRAKNRSFFDNLCMDGEIDRAIRKLN